MLLLIFTEALQVDFQKKCSNRERSLLTFAAGPEFPPGLALIGSEEEEAGEKRCSQGG